MRHLRRLTGLLGLLTTFFIVLHAPVSAAETAKRILILPLTIHSEKDLSFLNKGIMDMLASRIGPAATVIRENTLPPGKDPIQMGRDLNADYVITGSLTLFGNSVSTDAILAAVENGDTVLQYNRFGQSSSDVLMHVDEFAGQARNYFAAQTAVPKTAEPVQTPRQAAQPAQPVAQPVLKPTAPAKAPAPAPQEPPVVVQTPAPAPATTTATPTDRLWTSNPYRGTIRALAVADVDGNAGAEIIFVHENNVVVASKSGDRLDALGAFDAGKRHKTISVDAGDIDGNGRAEIFVTRLDAHQKLDSVVLEWEGAALQPKASNQKWYFRIGPDSEKGPVLMGQRRGSAASNDTGGLYEYDHFMPGIFELTWTGKTYQAGRRIPVPSGMNIYRFARGDIFNDGNIRAIAYSDDDELRITTPSGSPQWAGQEALGGSPFYLETTSAADARTKDRTYLAQRFVPADLDGDGTLEVVTADNRDAARGFVERFRKYTRGRVIALRWNKVNMKEVWSGEEVSGFVSDFAVADLDGDDRMEAVYAMVTSTGLLQSRSSNLVVEQIGDLAAK